MRSLPAWFLAFLAPAIPAQQVSDYSLFGEGCASPAGVPTLEPIPGSFPTIGETFTLQISNLPVGFFDAQALVLLGFSNTDWAGDPLPMDLSRFGLFGCTGYTSVDAAFLVSSPTDTALFSLDIPSQPRLLGTHFFNQALVQATGTNPFGAVVSNAVEAVVGDTTHAFEIRESFENDTKFDPVASSGSWGNSRVVPGRIGGDGRHGSFDVRSGVEVSPELYRWDTDNTVIPGELTVSGHPELVTDGRYFFTDFVLGPGQTLQFVGSKSAQIFVRGRVDIAGTITANAPHVFQDTLYRFEGTPLAPPRFRPRPSTAVGPIAGEPATIGIVGGGSGGRGGDSGDGLGHQARFDGEDGEDVQLLAGHAYLNRAFGTGGRGTPQFPPSGLNSDVTFNVFFNSRSGMIGAGGGGGGFSSPGSAGEATETASLMPGDLGPIGLGGIEMSLFADAQGSLPPGTASLEHFTIGGPGGGGGGSHPFVGAEATSPPGGIWKAGAAGAPGGGAIAIRAGGPIAIQPTGTIEARAGSGRSFTESADSYPMPGGGGGGGSILLQSDQTNGIVQDGFLDTSGGARSTVASFLINGRSHGGDGSPGFVRMETPDGNIQPGNTIPTGLTGNTGQLLDTDTSTGAQSLWYTTGQTSPTFVRYEVEATIDSVSMLFSDDASVSALSANDPNGPVYVLFQSARLDDSTGLPEPGSIGPWRSYVGTASGQPETLNLDNGDGFRFQIVFNRTVAQDIAVNRVSVFHR